MRLSQTAPRHHPSSWYAEALVNIPKKQTNSIEELTALTQQDFLSVGQRFFDRLDHEVNAGFTAITDVLDVMRRSPLREGRTRSTRADRRLPWRRPAATSRGSRSKLSRNKRLSLPPSWP